MKYILILLVLYLLYRLVRGITLFAIRSRRHTGTEPEPPQSRTQSKKMIPKDEGEYVDFEEMKD